MRGKREGWFLKLLMATSWPNLGILSSLVGKMDVLCRYKGAPGCSGDGLVGVG